MLGVRPADAKAHSLRGSQAGKHDQWAVVNTVFIGARDHVEAGPQAYRLDLEPGSVLTPHFHEVDQYQVVVGGAGRLGKLPLAPVSVHYADRFTPYGPVVAGDSGLTFFTLRVEHAVGSRKMPEEKASLKQAAARAGRTFTTQLEAGGLPLTTGVVRVAGYQDGTEVLRLAMAPDAEGAGPEAEATGGQFYLVLDGEAVVEGNPFGGGSVLWVDPADRPTRLRAGEAGADLLLLQFRPQTDPA